MKKQFQKYRHNFFLSILIAFTLLSLTLLYFFIKPNNSAIGLATGPAGTPSVTRTFNVTSTPISSSFTVTLTIDPINDETFYAIEETIPVGFTLMDVGNGNYNSADGRIRWYYLNETNANASIPTEYLTKTYILSAPSIEGIYTFFGQCEFEDDPESRTIIGNALTVTNISNSTNCTENWDCTEWTACSENEQSRACSDLNQCGTTELRPILTQACTMPEPEDITQPYSSPFIFKGSPIIFKGSLIPPKNTTQALAKTVCSDGKDNEGQTGRINGCIDEVDHLCGGLEFSCTDNWDNNCDGKKDCADTDCATDPTCKENIDVNDIPVFNEPVTYNDTTSNTTNTTTDSPDDSSPAEVNIFFGFIHWIILFILILALISLLVINHIRPKLNRVQDVPKSDIDNIQNYIRKKRKEGTSDDIIRRNLKTVGWIDEVIDKGMITGETNPIDEVKPEKEEKKEEEKKPAAS